MDGCVTTSPAYASSSSNAANSKNQGHNGRLSNGSSAYGSGSSSNNTPSTPNKHVNFGGQNQEERKREKFLTAKYGAHQMALIRKRLRVEMWMYERLQELYGADDIEIDLDEVLDLEDDLERRRYISELLRVDHTSTVSKDNLNIFVGDLLEKVKTL